VVAFRAGRVVRELPRGPAFDELAEVMAA
jgi:hypothetical protein